ncbi:aminoglycoside phosphotransferase family protein [Halobacteriovorax sp. HLS]|uniref:aminoglycoside phosphotransferase family protein n=1 Tax=Halobacteriovorax sp. HLS TaxID=2234000 RepID=UPI000FDCB6ED|nr:aminoglycoside phosphotransferase family protein [Halobacteriovorax sp. HLS]
MNEFLKNTILKSCDAKSIVKEEEIQSLWSGYGTLTRVTTDNYSVILKLVTPPKLHDHPRGWNSNLSHKRKLNSYEVEIYWYKNYNKNIVNAYSPRLIAAGEMDDSQYLILEDLGMRDYLSLPFINEDQIKLCINWLASFHATYLDVAPKNLWKVGTYWHLETRPEELEALEDKELKEAARKIDHLLNNAQFQTFVHGDAKLANFLFKDTESCAAVDFQYVGRGIGMKDLAYFLSSIYSEEQLIEQEKWCLDYYFFYLQSALEKTEKNIDFKVLEKQWRDLYPVAWCDFIRFLKGWSPGHYKINTYTENITKKVLSCI